MEVKMIRLNNFEPDQDCANFAEMLYSKMSELMSEILDVEDEEEGMNNIGIE